MSQETKSVRMKQIFEMHGQWHGELVSPIQPIECTILEAAL